MYPILLQMRPSKASPLRMLVGLRAKSIDFVKNYVTKVSIESSNCWIDNVEGLVEEHLNGN